MSDDIVGRSSTELGTTRETPRITLYSFAPSQNAVRPELALREKGLEFEKVELNLLKGEHKRAPFSELTPRGQVPILVYDDGTGAIVVYESISTIRFIDDMHPEPALMPPVSEPSRRAVALTRIEEFQAQLNPRNVFGSVIFGRQNLEQLGKRVDELLDEIERWEAYVAGQSYLAGDQFTLADIAVFPVLMHFEALGYDYEARTPALAEYIARCKTRPSVQASGWLEAFATFAGERSPERVLAGSTTRSRN